MATFFEMRICMFAFVSAATNFTTNEALPKTCLDMTNLTFQCAIADLVLSSNLAFEFMGSKSRGEIVMGVTTDGTATTRPLFQARTMKDVLAGYGQQPSSLVHSFQANRTSRKFD